MVNPDRITALRNKPMAKGPVIYWMSREQRVIDNWALLYAIEMAEKLNTSMAVVFCLYSLYPGANIRHFDFLLRGLQITETKLRELNIPFYLLKGDPVTSLSSFLKEYKADVLITDFDPLRIKKQWKEKLVIENDISFIEVDAHNIVPCRKVSNKMEFGAYTIRPKIRKLLPEFLDRFPDIHPQKKQNTFPSSNVQWEREFDLLQTDRSVKTVDWLKPGENSALEIFEYFLHNNLQQYADKRNNPNEKVLSLLSPYLHFGHISAQRVAMEIEGRKHNDVNTKSFLEELIIRRELSDNYCFYNPHYDSIEGFPGWARETLEKYRKYEREFIYSTEEFERGETHDLLWNAAQNEMVNKGKMHGFMRMYWAKKILEWTHSPQEALRVSIFLNDKYELDGRDPNGYTGCAWAIGGVHDRAWSERPVFGKIRYMNYNGCKRKFDVVRYIKENMKE